MSDKQKITGIQKYLQTTPQIFFSIFIVFTLCGLVPFTKGVYDHLQINKARAPPDYEFPKIADFWISIVAAMGFNLIHKLF